MVVKDASPDQGSSPARELAQRWIATLEVRKSANTISAYESGIRAYLCFCRKRNFDPIAPTPKSMAAYHKYLVGEGPVHADHQPPGGYAKATVYHRFVVLRLWFDFLVIEGVIDQSPVPRGERNKRPGYATQPDWEICLPGVEAIKRFFKVASEDSLRNKLMLALSYSGALRRSELARLRIGDFELDRRRIHVRGETTKNGQSKTVHYPASGEVLLQKYRELRRQQFPDVPTEGRLFRSESNRNRGSAITAATWTKVVEKWADNAEAPVTTHTFRHLRLTHLAKAGISPLHIANYAGHASIDSTMVYIHLASGSAAAKVENTLSFITEKVNAAYELI